MMTFIYDMTMYDRAKRVISMKVPSNNSAVLEALAIGKWPDIVIVHSYHTRVQKPFEFYNSFLKANKVVYYNRELDVDLHLILED